MSVGKIIYIDAPERLTRRQRTVSALLTGLMWAAYAYLWLPLFSLLAWGLGIRFAYDVMIEAGGASALRSALFWYAVLLVDVVLAVAIWSLLNKWRFAGHNRRTAHEHVADATLAAYFGIAARDLEQLRAARCIAVDIDGQGKPTVVVLDERGDSTPSPAVAGTARR